MNQKTLNRLIIALGACMVSIALTLIIVTMISKEQGLLSLLINLLSVIADAVIMIALYYAIQAIFPHRTIVSVFTAAIGIIIILPLWYGFKLFAFEGDFNLGVVFNSLYVMYVNNFIVKIVNALTTYFGLTLFTSPDVVNQFFTFLLKFLTDSIHYVLIPILPIVLMIRDSIVGNEEYQFNNDNAMFKDENEPKV